MRAGDVVMVSLPSTNRDPDFMADADVFDVTRQPQAHLAFGHGIHQCLGQQLARLEMSVALPALLQRFPTLVLGGVGSRPDIPSGRSSQRHPCPTGPLVAQHELDDQHYPAAMSDAPQHPTLAPRAAAEPWVSDPEYRQGAVDLLGILAYGALAAFDRLAEDARHAPTLPDKVHIASMAAVQIKHFETVRARLAEFDTDVMVAMKPFYVPFNEFHAHTKPKDWLEGLVLAYVGNGFAADFYREVAAFVDADTRALVHEVSGRRGPRRLRDRKGTCGHRRRSAGGGSVGAVGASSGWRSAQPGSARGCGPRRPDPPLDGDRRPSRHGSRCYQPNVLPAGGEPHPPHDQARPAGLTITSKHEIRERRQSRDCASEQTRNQPSERGRSIDVRAADLQAREGAAPSSRASEKSRAAARRRSERRRSSSASDDDGGGSQRAICASEQPRSNSSETDVAGVLLTQVDVGDLRHRDQHFAAALVGERKDSVATDRNRTHQFLLDVAGRLGALHHDFPIDMLNADLDLHCSSW